MYVSLAAKTALGAGGSADFGRIDPPSVVSPGVGVASPMPRAWVVGCAIPSAALTAGAVQLQGSLDDVNFYNIGSPVTVTGSASPFLLPGAAGAGARFVRAAITTAVTGGTVTVQVDAAP